MKRRLTDRTLKSLPPAISKRRHYDLMDDLVQGFGVRVHMDGRKTFILIARYPGSRHPTRRALGQYENGMTLESARKKAGQWRSLLADGIDPKVETERKAREEARARSDSFATVVEAYIAHIRRAKYRSVRDVERCLEREFTSHPKFFEEIEDRLLKHYDLTIETDDRPPPWQPQKTKPHGQGPKGLRTDKIKARIRSVMKDKKMKAEAAAWEVAGDLCKESPDEYPDRAKLTKQLVSKLRHK